jgi:hypothetical protein
MHHWTHSEKGGYSLWGDWDEREVGRMSGNVWKREFFSITLKPNLKAMLKVHCFSVRLILLVAGAAEL